jgi:hypothetical protein
VVERPFTTQLHQSRTSRHRYYLFSYALLSSHICFALLGAALCQIFDSIYGDVPLHKVKFNTVQEYEYVLNFKIHQKTFKDHHVDKVPCYWCLKLLLIVVQGGASGSIGQVQDAG